MRTDVDGGAARGDSKVLEGKLPGVAGVKKLGNAAVGVEIYKQHNVGFELLDERLEIDTAEAYVVGGI